MKTLAAIRPLKEQIEAELLQRHGGDRGRHRLQVCEGQEDGRFGHSSIRDRKREVAEKERIPKTLKGIQTDVIQRTFVLQSLRRPRDEIVLMSDGTLRSHRGRHQHRAVPWHLA